MSCVNPSGYKQYDSGERTFKEIADTLGLKKGTVQYAYHSGIEKIRKSFGDEKLDELLDLFHALSNIEERV